MRRWRIRRVVLYQLTEESGRKVTPFGIPGTKKEVEYLRDRIEAERAMERRRDARDRGRRVR